MPSEHLAPELRVPDWIDASGQPLDKPLTLADLGDGWKIIFAFQHWCPGCHFHGFPTLKALYDGLHDKGVGFAAIQTVFEGAEQNTPDKLREEQTKYDLPIPFGQDPLPADHPFPTFMEDYRTRGTPWFTIIGPNGAVVYSGFQLDAAQVVNAWDDEAKTFRDK